MGMSLPCTVTQNDPLVVALVSIEDQMVGRQYSFASAAVMAERHRQPGIDMVHSTVP